MSYYDDDDDDFNKAQRELAVKIAAYFISKGSSRDGAIKTAKDYLKEQKEIPVGEENDWKRDELADKYGVPSDSDLNTRQVQAIAKDIDDLVDYP